MTHSCTLFPSRSEVQPVKMSCSQVSLLEGRVWLVYGSCSCGGVCQSHREQVQPHNMSTIENSDSPLAFQVQLQRQRRPPISLTFWAPSRGFRGFGSGWEWRGGPDTEGLCYASKRYRPSVCASVLAECHGSCCWMWPPSRHRSQRNLREFQCGWL